MRLGKKVRQICETHNLKTEKYFAYGEIDGYLFTVTEKGGLGNFYINCAFNTADMEEKMKSIQEFLDRKTKLYPRPTYKFDRYGVEVHLYENYKFVKSAENLISEITKFLRNIGVSGADKCCLCGEPIQNLTAKKLYRNGHVLLCDSACAYKAVREIQENTDSLNETSKNYGKGTIGALILGIVGTIPWIIVYLIGYFVGWLGVIIAICARKGYEMFGGKEGRLKAVVVILVTFFCVFFAQFAGVCMELWFMCSDEGFNLGISEIVPLTFTMLAEEPEVMGYFISNLMMGLLFAIFGLWGTISSIIHERKEITAQVTVLN